MSIKLHGFFSQRFLRVGLLSALAVSLGACATYRDIAPNSPVHEVLARMGQPSLTCPKDDGGGRLVWSYQPYGQYGYGANVSKEGIVERVESVLTDTHFRRLDSGTWTQQDVVCEFGPPAETSRLGLGEKNALIWSYRYKQGNAWNSLMHVYFGGDGSKVTRYHSGPDPLYEVDDWFGRW
ncbi:MAG: hypothetical protein Q4G54_00885 [Pelistega sp.]|nr:hypothetical protein [Pelistega sp.]